MTIGIILSLAAKGRLILKKYLYFGKQKQNKKWTTGSFGKKIVLKMKNFVHQNKSFFLLPIVILEFLEH